MRYGLFVMALVLMCAVAVLSLLWIDSLERDSVTLAELASVNETNSMPALTKIDFTESLNIGDTFFAGLETSTILYALLGVCAIFLALRAVMSILGVLQAKRLGAVQRNYDFHERLEAEDQGAEERTRRSPSAAPLVMMQFLKRCTRGVTGRIVFTFAGIVSGFGLLAMALVYHTVASSLREHVMQRAVVTAINVSDGAPRFLLRNNASGLRELLRKHTGKREHAYILVENRAGEIFAHNFAVLSQEIQDRPSLGADRTTGRRTLRIGESMVEEVSVPILEGRGGAVRVGIWRESIDAEIDQTLMLQIKLLGVVVVLGVLAAVLLAWRINRPIRRLVAAAKAISTGDLDRPAPQVEEASEIGELSRAIERMRSSVKAAMTRLAG